MSSSRLLVERNLERPWTMGSAYASVLPDPCRRADAQVVRSTKAARRVRPGGRLNRKQFNDAACTAPTTMRCLNRRTAV